MREARIVRESMCFKFQCDNITGLNETIVCSDPWDNKEVFFSCWLFFSSKLSLTQQTRLIVEIRVDIG